ncbi:cyclic nucleotide-binding domain-containing protein [Konateibacter massiliensis]|uniref:cyclic nucleotide-binding domain-containing protein n=1 Tax=Konateibacter massiliensis TaxID=2002841 RepID=UPI0015D5083D|nr:cyclic nucleotide-binding domain-containing protein [Konateibacter massiliensis]
MGRSEQPMMTRKLAAGAVIYQEGDAIKEVSIIVTGSVKAKGKYGENVLMAGNVIGVLEMGTGRYLYNYVADEETLICYFTVETTEELCNIFAKDASYPGIVVSSLSKQMISLTGEFESLRGLSSRLYGFIQKEYREYKEICEGYRKEPAQIKRIENIEEFDESSINVNADLEYYINLDLISLDLKKKFYAANEYIMTAEIKRTQEYVVEMEEAYETIIAYVNEVKNALFAKDEDNIFMRLAELAFMINDSNGDIAMVYDRIKQVSAFVSGERYIEQSVLPILLGHFKTKIKVGSEFDDEQADLTRHYTVDQIKRAKVLTKDSLDTILEFSGIEKEKGDKFKQYLTVYNSLPDKSALTDETDKLRKAITKFFYELYELVFFKAEETQLAEPVIDLFLNYGFVDERFLTEMQLLQLLYFKKEEEPSEYPIYTIREWLQEIYRGKAEPSKNEFDLDYLGMLRDRKRTQHVSEAEEKAYLSDMKGKVQFEISNMFRVANKITSGKVLTFCPILHKDSLGGDMNKLLRQKSEVVKAYENLQAIDYSLFYRKMLYHDSSKGISKEYIEKRVLPITILMPNSGLKGSMWQETSGLKKDTPARFILPVLSKDTPEELLISVMGYYRWEICRNIQGVYWSDITEKSLTAEYYDYIQFYKKNRDLSIQAKDKIRSDLSKVRNNYREFFAQDYIQWMRFESKGASRLNEFARGILMTYCPFPKKVRTELTNFPAFAKLMDKYELQRAALIKKTENAYTSIRRSGGTITKELEDTLEFYKK